MPPEMRELVKQVMGEAKRHSGLASAFLLEIQPYVRKKDYRENTVSAWLTGRAVPPAEVLLAAAKVSGVSLDKLLFGESYEERLDRLERGLGDLQNEVRRKHDLA